MTIVCGTDFSAGARQALRAAVAIAKRERTAVELVHVVDLRGVQALLARSEGLSLPSPHGAIDAWLDGARAVVTAEARGVAASGVDVTPRVVDGSADVALVAHAAACGADLIVVAALGERAGTPFTLGSTADRVAQTAACPVLVVRDSTPFEAWADGRKELRLCVGVDTSSTADAALRWTNRFASLGDVVAGAGHVYWPPEQRQKHPEWRALPLGGGQHVIERELEADLADRIRRNGATLRIPLRVVGGLGRVADHLAHIASEDRADALVVGAHQRTGLRRLWHGSVSHGVVDAAHTNVFVVPESA